MRLISQDGTIDIPYLEVGLTVMEIQKSKTYQVVGFAVSNPAEWILAAYDSKGKAIRTLRLVGEVYAGQVKGFEDVRIFQFPKNEEMEKLMNLEEKENE